MSCCREIQRVESIWLLDNGANSVVVRHVLDRFHGDHDGKAVFHYESGDYQWYGWFDKDDAGQFTSARVAFRTPAATATASLVDDFTAGATAYRICVWQDGDWVIDDEADIDPSDTQIGILYPFGISIFAPQFRTWWPVGTENPLGVTYDQAVDPATQIKMTFSATPLSGGGPVTIEKTFRYLSRNTGGTDNDLEFATLAGLGSFLENAAVVVTPDQFVYQADESPVDGVAGNFPVRLCLTFSQCRTNDFPTDVRVATLVAGGPITGGHESANVWHMAIYSPWNGEWTPVSEQAGTDTGTTTTANQQFRLADTCGFPANLTYFAGLDFYQLDPQYIIVTGFEVL